MKNVLDMKIGVALVVVDGRDGLRAKKLDAISSVKRMKCFVTSDDGKKNSNNNNNK